MNPKLQQLERATADYPEFKAHFSSFIEQAKKLLTDNPALPGVVVSADGDGTSAKIRILDQTFVLRFHLLALGSFSLSSDQRIGVLAVYLPSLKGEESLLWYTFFDYLGNVRDSPDAKSANWHLADKRSLHNLLSECTDRYFALMAERFNAKVPSP